MIAPRGRLSSISAQSPQYSSMPSAMVSRRSFIFHVQIVVFLDAEQMDFHRADDLFARIAAGEAGVDKIAEPFIELDSLDWLFIADGPACLIAVRQIFRAQWILFRLGDIARRMEQLGQLGVIEG